MNESLLELLIKGGFTIFVLIICSILSLKVIIEKFFIFKSLDEQKANDLTYKVKTSLQQNKPSEALNYCNDSKVKSFLFTSTLPLAPVYKFMIDHYHYEKEELVEASLNKLDQELVKSEKGLGILGTLGAITPFIGLFGTVIGIIRSFTALSVGDVNNYTKVMAGISEALIATAAGLFVAIPSVMFYNYFMKRLRNSIPMFEENIHTVVRVIKNESKG